MTFASASSRVDNIRHSLVGLAPGDLLLIKVIQIYRDADDRPLVTCRETFIAR